MATLDNLPTWITILDRLARALSPASADQNEVAALRAQLAGCLARAEEPSAELLSGLRAFVSRHGDELITVVETIMSEVFPVIDAEMQRLRKARASGPLSPQDRAAGQEYVALLEACNAILEEMKSVPAVKNG